MGFFDSALDVGTLGVSRALRGNGYDTSTQAAFETPEQRAARQLLLKYSQRGQIGDNYTAGEDLNMPMGDYGMTGMESNGLASIADLLNSGQNSQYQMGDAGLRDIMDTSEAGMDKMFSPYKALAEREGRDAENTFKRSAGAIGNLYGTDTVRRLGDVSARTAENNMANLSTLMNQALNRKTQGIGLAYQSGQAREDNQQNRINQAMTYGGLSRNLNDAALKANYNEKLRQRGEIENTLSGANSVSGANVQWGVPSIQTPKENPYMDFLKLIVSGGSEVAGAYAGRK